MFELISIISVVLAIAALASARGARARLETEIAALKLELKRIETQRPTAAAQPLADEALAAEPEASPDMADHQPIEPVAADMVEETISEPVAEQPPMEMPEPIRAMEQPSEPTAETPKDAPKAAKAENAAKKESWESRIAAQWTVWVGGIALAFAGIFAVKYSIDQGFFSPAVRLSAAALFGLVLVGVGEWLRRRTDALTEKTFANAMIPGVLTAAGSLTLFGAVFVAHGVYAYFGPVTAFILLAAISIGTLGLSLLHGQALAGVGLLTSFITPLLISTGETKPWSLFGFLTIVWISSLLASKIRGWRVAPALANVGLSIWGFLYIVGAHPFEVLPVALPMVIMAAGLAFIWPGTWKPVIAEEPAEGTVSLDAAGRPVKAKSAWEHVFLPGHLASTLTAALGIMVVAMVLVAPDLDSAGYGYLGFACLVIVLALFGAYRPYAIYPAIFAAVAAFGGIRILSIATASPGFQPADDLIYTDPSIVIAIALSLGLFLAALASAVVFRRRDTHPEFTRVWILIGAITPLVLGTLSFFFFGNYAFDLKHGLFGVVLGAIYLASAWTFYGQSEKDGRFDVNRDLLVAASWAGFVFALLVMTNGLTTTLAVAILGFIYLNGQRIKNWPMLPWIMVASAIFVAGRIAWEPTIVGPNSLSTTPVFNQLLVGYGIPTLLLIASAWLVRKSTDDRIRNMLDALACLFTLLTIAILVRHAMNGGTLNSDTPTLAEQAIYSLLAIGTSVTLMVLDLRRPSIIFRTGSMAAGYVSMASIIFAHFLALNPYFTWEPTGQIPFFNLLFLAYLLPGIAYAGAAYVARSRRPQHYVIALALSGAALLFAYVTLSVRRIYHGADIADWKGFLQAELYTYSIVWLVLGVGLLVAGYRFRSKSLRIASAVLVLITVLKVFLIDMGNLEGLYRVLSFIGLGVALIGIGRFYQTVLTGLEKEESQAEPVLEPQA